MKLSVVTTLFLSENYIQEFYERVSKSVSRVIGEDYELIFVDDGSPDDSLKKLCKILQKDNRVKVIELSRNFGHHKAMMTGLKYASGDRVFLIDCDLEEKPEYFKNFHEEMEKSKPDVVYGVQDIRKGQIFERLTGAIFWNLINIVSGLPFTKNLSTIRLMSQNYVKCLTQHNEHEIFIAGLWLITGFEQKPISIIKSSNDKTTYSLRAKLNLLINSITSFSNRPLIAIFHSGFIIFISSICYILYLIYSKLYLLESLPGWTSVIASVWLLGGLIISFLGVIGIYLSKMFIETKKRPYSIIKKIHKSV